MPMYLVNVMNSIEDHMFYLPYDFDAHMYCIMICTL